MQPILCLMGPTASGKTPLAVEIVQHFPCEIISVDSAQVYREMNIGTAKPEAHVLKIAPHHLIDIRDPNIPYSAGEFLQDAFKSIQEIIARKKIPLLVGGTMLYFRVLQQGLAQLPSANDAVRQQLAGLSIDELYSQLQRFDPISAKRIHSNDSQRIRRALEVYFLTGKSISESQAAGTQPLSQFAFHNLILVPSARATLHARIAQRFEQMMKTGLLEEVSALYKRGDLTADLPAIRAVGYRQLWDYFAGETTYTEMNERAIAATRQLAKRQLTWLRKWPNGVWFDSDKNDLFAQVKEYVEKFFTLT